MTTAEDVERVARASSTATVTLRWRCREVARAETPFAEAHVYGLCGRSFTLTHDRDAYERRMCSARCPSCGATLRQRDGDCEVVNAD